MRALTAEECNTGVVVSGVELVSAARQVLVEISASELLSRKSSLVSVWILALGLGFFLGAMGIVLVPSSCLNGVR